MTKINKLLCPLQVKHPSPLLAIHSRPHRLLRSRSNRSLMILLFKNLPNNLNSPSLRLLPLVFLTQHNLPPILPLANVQNFQHTTRFIPNPPRTIFPLSDTPVQRICCISSIRPPQHRFRRVICVDVELPVWPQPPCSDAVGGVGGGGRIS